MADRKFVGRDQTTIHNAFLRVLRAGFIKLGIENPNVTPGSDDYVTGEGVASQMVVVEAGCAAQGDAVMPDTAQGDDLLRIAAIFGIEPQPAAPAAGNVILSAIGAVTINLGDRLVDGAGKTFKTTVAGTFNDGDAIAIIGDDTFGELGTGDSTNHDEGDVLRWHATPVNADEDATVDVGGLTGGTDAEDVEAVRARLFDKLRNPPMSGNCEDVCEAAEDSTGSVLKAFCYPGIRGAGSYGVAVVGRATATSKSRVVNSAIVSGIIAPFITGKYPEHADAIITTVVDVETDVAFGLSIPDAPTASPPGPGGGWTNGTPWPSVNGTSTFKVAVTAVSSTLQFTVDATTAPTPNVTQICWWSPFEYKLYKAKVIAVSGTSGAYVITLDNPFVGIATGCLIWPACLNAQAYCDAVMGAYALMGPGEKTTHAGLVARAFRHPPPAQGWPSSLGGHLTKALQDARTEVASAQFLYRTDGATTLNGSGGLIYPAVPPLLTDEPKQFIPHHIGFYRVN